MPEPGRMRPRRGGPELRLRIARSCRSWPATWLAWLPWLCVLSSAIGGGATARAQSLRTESVSAGATTSATRSSDGNAAAEGSLSPTLGPPLALPPSLLGRPVTRLEVVTAGGRWQTSEQLREPPLGQPLSAAYARAVLREILRSGRYAEATASAQAYGSGALL